VARVRILAVLVLAAAVPATAQTFGFSLGSAPPVCLAIGNATWRLARSGADVTVRIDPAVATSNVRIKLVETADEADFIFVDDGATPACHGGSTIKSVKIDPAAAAPDLTLAFASASAPADYRIYVRSRWLAPEAVAALFAAAHMPARTLAGRAPDRSN
jgi:fructose-specific component phosphotransferase system IIB-like protein